MALLQPSVKPLETLVSKEFVIPVNQLRIVTEHFSKGSRPQFSVSAIHSDNSFLAVNESFAHITLKKRSL